MKKIYAILPLIILASCSPDEVAEPVRPVIEAWIDSDGYPVVMFTASLYPDNVGESLQDKIIRWGKVTISDGDQTVLLTGGADDSYMPPYRYYTYKMQGIPGKTYTIDAEYNNLHATAQCIMPEPTPIDGIVLEKNSANPQLRAATLQFTAPDDCPAYYVVNITDYTDPSVRSPRPLPAMLGAVEAVNPGETVSVPVNSPKNYLSDDDYTPQLRVGQRLAVDLCRVSEEVYRFRTQYDNTILFGGAVFVSSSSSLQGNINGGYGIFSAQGTSRFFLQVE